MKWSTTLIFSALFALVASVYFQTNSPLAPKLKEGRSPSGPQNTQFLIDQSDIISWLQIQNTGKKEIITLARQGETWTIKFPVLYPASRWMIDEMMRMLLSTPKIRQLSPEKSWEEYGLLKPEIKIGLESRQFPKRRYLCLGGPSPVGDVIFARWEGASEYFLVSSELKRLFDRSAYMLREKRVFRIPLTDVTKIRFQMGNEKYELIRYKKFWKWVNPSSRRGMTMDGASAGEFAAGMRDLYIKDFLDQESGEKDFSFFKPLHSIKVWGTEKRSELVYVGQEVPVRDAFYGRREGEKVFFLIDRNNLRALFDTVKASSRGSVE